MLVGPRGDPRCDVDAIPFHGGGDWVAHFRRGCGASEVLSDTTLLLLVVLAVLSSPGACRCYAFFFSPLAPPTRTSLDSTVPGTTGRSSPLVTAITVQQLSDDELAAAWRHSGAALERAIGPDQRLAWVLARQAYLDEFQRRNPKMFNHWLARSAATTELSQHDFPHRLTGPGSDAA